MVGLLLLWSNFCSAQDIVNVYSARKEALIKPLLEQFSDATGIAVNLVTGKADALLKRIEVEGSASPADLFITVDAGRLHRAKVAGILQSVASPALESAIPKHLRDVDGYWYGLSQRARVIVYVKDKVLPAELSTYEDLSHSRWKSRLCLRSSNNIYNQSLVASMLEVTDENTLEDWVRSLVANVARPPVGGDTDQLKAAASGLCDLTLVNTYYVGRLMRSEEESLRKMGEKLAVFWPNQGTGERGAHVNVSGAGVTKHARNKANALRLIEFLVSDKSQVWYADVNNEYPVVDGVSIPEVLQDFGPFRSDQIPLSRLGELNRAAVELMDRGGWR